MSQPWSARLSEKFGLRLPRDVADWLDHERWNAGAAARFNQPIEPAEIADPHSPEIWGGLMLPDTLPLLSDGGGNKLCLRFAPDGTVSEVIRWSEEGSSWRPYGKTLAEALLLDAALTLTDGATDDGTLRPTGPDFEDELFAFARWAVQWVGSETSGPLPLKKIFGDGSESPILTLLRAGVAEVAVRQHLAESYSSSGLRRMCLEIGGRRVAKILGVDWPQFQTWLFDAELIPQDYRERLSGVTATPVEELLQQDWISAASEAQKVVSLRTDLAWPFAVLGWSSERSGDIDAAFAYYTAGLESPETSAGFTTGWRAKAGLHHKFAAERLIDLDQTLSPPRLNSDYLQALSQNKNPALGAREYWTREGEAAERARQYDRAYRCYFNAGWDLYVSDEMQTVLKRLARVAEALNYRVLYELALHHLKSLKTT